MGPKILGYRKEVPQTTTNPPNSANLYEPSETRTRVWYPGDKTDLPITPGKMTPNEITATQVENIRRRTRGLILALEYQFKDTKRRNVVLGPQVPVPPLVWPPAITVDPLHSFDQPPRFNEIRNYLIDRYQQLALDTMASPIPEHTMYKYLG